METLVALPVIRNVTAVENGAILTLAWTTPCDVDMSVDGSQPSHWLPFLGFWKATRTGRG